MGQGDLIEREVNMVTTRLLSMATVRLTSTRSSSENSRDSQRSMIDTATSNNYGCDIIIEVKRRGVVRSGQVCILMLLL